MKRATSLLVLGAFLVAAAILPVTSAMAQCGTQGAFALALAQLLDFEVTEQEAAIQALVGVGLSADLWEPTACMTEEVVVAVDKAMKRAFVAGLIRDVHIYGVIQAALDSIGEGELISALQGLPDTPASGEYRALNRGGFPLEGRTQVEIPPGPTLPEAIEGRPTEEASPYVP